MSFVLNEAQQISLFDAQHFLSKRKREMLDKSWANTFSQTVFSKINEQIFAPLYSEKTNSRPNAPINVLVGALILKDYNGLTDEGITEACEFDFRFQYALHTTSFEVQPVSERSLSRFRSRLAAYELLTGEDLLHKCFEEMAEGLRKYMDIAPVIRRMDSLMIETSARTMGRLELLHACMARLVRTVRRDAIVEIPEGILHYADPNDANQVTYHDQDTPYEERLQKVIDDAVSFLPLCEADYSENEDYLLLVRAIEEQTRKDDNGHNIPKGKGDGISSSALQNPSDPDATYRMKAGKAHRGYSANITETVDGSGSIVTDYQYDVNTRSDRDFLRETIEKTEPTESTIGIIADGAYGGEEIEQMAAEKNIGLITTGLLGRKPREILTKFRLSDDGQHIVECPEGNVPRTSSYIWQNDLIRVSFERSCCEDCPHQEECGIRLKARTAVMFFSLGSLAHMKEIESRKDDKVMAVIGRIRNGIETVPSVLRRKYRVDHMSVRGKLKTKIAFGFKICAFNLGKVYLHDRGKERCRAFEANLA